MSPCRRCVTILGEFVPIQAVATLISEYVPHRTDLEVIGDRLGFGRKWELKTNDDFVNWKREPNIKRQEVIFKIYRSNNSIMDKPIPLR
jgi:hypothetical protein